MPHTVHVRRADSSASRVAVALVAAFALLLGPLAAAPSHAADYTVSGTVSLPGNVPVPEHSVTLEKWDADEEDFQELASSETDEAGQYSFAGVTGGQRYQVTVDDVDGYAPHVPEDFTLSANKTVNVTFVQAGTMTGKVVDSDSAPIAGADVVAYPWSGSALDEENTSDAVTNEVGEYEIEALRPGSYKVQISVEGANYQSAWVSVGGSDVITVTGGQNSALGTTTLLRGAELSGKVTLADGSAAYDIGISVIPMKGSKPDEEVSFDTSTNEDGTWTLGGLAAGRYIVYFGGDEEHLDEYYNNKANEEDADVITLAAQETRALGTTQLDLPGNLVGTVKNAKGKRLEYIYVEAFPVVGGKVARESADATETDDRGEFLFEELRGGATYRLKFVDDEGAYKSSWSANLVVTGGTERSVGTFTLAAAPKKSASVKVKVKGGKKRATFTVTVKASGVTPTGKVTVKLGSKTLKSGKLKKGKVTIKVTKQKKGKRRYRVVYAGDDRVKSKTVSSPKVKIK
jgi:hypothetical protein